MRYNNAVTDARSSLRVDKAAHDGSGEIVLALTGELDLATIVELKDAVTSGLGSDVHVVLDLAGLTFCDSTGLGAFIALFREARARGGRLALAAPRKRVGDLLTLSGIDQVIPVYESTAAAFAGPVSSQPTGD
jgi:anti-sigma B factor antagonist